MAVNNMHADMTEGFVNYPPCDMNLIYYLLEIIVSSGYMTCESQIFAGNQLGEV